MKKLFTLLSFFICLGVYQSSSAQCTIDSTNTTVGITPDSIACLQRGQPVGYPFQVYVPASVSGGFPVTVDSVRLDSIGGLPTGVVVTGNPVTGVINGGGWGCLWVSGTPTGAVGSYNPIFYITVYYQITGFPLGEQTTDTTLGGLGYNFTINICDSTVHPAPVAGFFGNPLSGCGSVTTHFTDTSSLNPIGWSWTFAGGSPATSSQQNPIVTFSSPGAHAVTLVATNANGSDSIATVSYVTVYADPSLSVQSTQASTQTTANGTATVTASGTQPFKYNWSNTDTLATDSNLLPGVYFVTVTDANQCHTLDTVTVTYVTGISTIANNMVVKIYPDPAYDYLNLSWSAKPDAEITITDLSGKVMMSVTAGSSTLSTLDIHALASGIYIVSIADKQTMQVQSARFAKY